MNETSLTSERIVAAAEAVLRRYGPAKATVVDVARALGVTHGSVYRHFANKAALRDAVIARWLDRISAPLADTELVDSSATKRLRHWFDLLRASKRRLASDDPELFATYGQLAAESQTVLRAHIDDLVAQLAALVADGVARGEFSSDDPYATARAIFDATVRFHNPLHVAEWAHPEHDAAFERVWALLLAGLEKRNR